MEIPQHELEGATWRYSVKAVEHACSILKALRDSDNGILSIREMVSILGLRKTTVIRIVKTLQDAGFLEQSSEGEGYRISPVLFSIGMSSVKGLGLKEAALPEMRKLAQQVRETVGLFVLSGRERVCIEKIDSPSPIRRHVEVGEVLPLHSSSSGRVFMAYMPKRDVEDILKGPLPSYTPNTITDPDELRQTLKQIRVRGYAISRGERIEGGIGISAPIFDPTGKVLACLSIMGTGYGISDDKADELAAMVVKAAKAVSRRFGA